MGVMTTPDFWSGQDRMLRSGAYKQTAFITGDEEYRAEIPFPVTITPSQLVSIPR